MTRSIAQNATVLDGNKAAANTLAAAKKDQKKKDFAEQQKTMQKLSTPGGAMVDNPIDKKAPASAPMKSISKMTPEERAQLRKDVAKESKP